MQSVFVVRLVKDTEDEDGQWEPDASSSSTSSDDGGSDQDVATGSSNDDQAAEEEQDAAERKSRRERLQERNEKVGLGWLTGGNKKIRVSVQPFGREPVIELREFRIKLLDEDGGGASDETGGGHVGSRSKRRSLSGGGLGGRRIKRAFRDDDSSEDEDFSPKNRAEGNSSSSEDSSGGNRELKNRKKKKKLQKTAEVASDSISRKFQRPPEFKRSFSSRPGHLSGAAATDKDKNYQRFSKSSLLQRHHSADPDRLVHREIMGIPFQELFFSPGRARTPLGRAWSTSSPATRRSSTTTVRPARGPPHPPQRTPLPPPPPARTPPPRRLPRTASTTETGEGTSS